MSQSIEDRLKGLAQSPSLSPPAGLEVHTLAAMAEAVRPESSAAYLKAAVWLIALGTAALLALWSVTPEIEEPGSDVVAAADPRDALLRELGQQAAALELTLAQMPPPRPVMRVSTAGTIVGLEDQLERIDAELDGAAAMTAPPEYRVALLRDRIEVMNALVNVRYVQSAMYTY